MGFYGNSWPLAEIFRTQAAENLRKSLRCIQKPVIASGPARRRHDAGHLQPRDLSTTPPRPYRTSHAIWVETVAACRLLYPTRQLPRSSYGFTRVTGNLLDSCEHICPVGHRFGPPTPHARGQIWGRASLKAEQARRVGPRHGLILQRAGMFPEILPCPVTPVVPCASQRRISAP